MGETQLSIVIFSFSFGLSELHDARRDCTKMSEQETQRPGMGEQEPLLGRPGDASLQEGLPLYHNLVIGTGAIAQAGSWILVAIVWGAVFSNPVILFSAHPLLNSAAILLFTQGVLIL